MHPPVLVWACLIAASLAAGGARAAEADEPLVGGAAPDFALRSIGGPNVRLSEHRGEVVVVTFWSSRCASCSDQLAALQRSLETYAAAGLTIFGVNVDDDPARAARFAEAHSLDFALLVDPAKEVSRRYRVERLPTTVLIDRGGAVRHLLRDYSEASDARYVQRLRALLNE